MFNQKLVLISLYSLNIIAITFTYWNVGNQNSLACTISLKKSASQASERQVYKCK